MPQSLSQETQTVLNKLHISPRKKFSQNFMVSESELIFIRDCVLPQKEPVVLEIGPGLGFLTRLLLERVQKVIAVEKDPVMIGHLKSFFKDQPLELVEKDILKLDLAKDLGIQSPIRVVGNIPYHITSPILEWLIEQR